MKDKPNPKEALSRLAEKLINSISDSFGAMPPSQFKMLMNSVKRATWDDDKIKVLESVAGHARLTSEQVVLLLKEFSWDEGRLTALEKIKGSIVDRQNSHIIVNKAFSFMSSERKAADILNKR